MQGPEATGPFCQSCGMPLRQPEDYGTEADGLMAEDYCRFCFQSGMFTAPDLSMQGMIDRSPDIPDRSRIIPALKRWQEKKPAGR
ncbi:MAG: zinc ribbon domain-containing protein [Elusimicrobia bacterium]|nr:zinc ribbon domain-containing protein [Elusimicrobiota bacterium]